MKNSLLELWRTLLTECGKRCRVSTELDFKKVKGRVDSEGLSFMTITLPAFEKEFVKALDQGRIASTSFPGFKKRGGLPLFLGGFLKHVFSQDGTLQRTPCISCIASIRQLCGFYGKIELECSKERTRSAFRGYVASNDEILKINANLSFDDLKRFARIFDLVFGKVCKTADFKCASFDLSPSHGPGTTADKLIGNEKFNSNVWHSRLNSSFPFELFAIPNLRIGRVEEVDFIDLPERELPVRVIAVPKTLKTPRIIAAEPVCMQYTQQALKDVLVPLLEESELCGPMIGFEQQAPNREMARYGSSSGRLATLDLSEASDRVSNLLVKFGTQKFGHLYEAIQACRSLTADVPGHGIIALNRYASMGSALCFPIEAMVFLTIVLISFEKQIGRRLTTEDLLGLHGRVRVYGDDIIVPVELTQFACSELETFGLKINYNKTFATGKFRESCGKDWYDGHDVSYVKVRQPLPARRRDVKELVSTVSLRNQLAALGYSDTVSFLDKKIKKILRFYPIVEETSPILGRHDHEVIYDRFCPRRHVPLVKGYVVQARSPKNELDGAGALMKHFIKRSKEPYAVDHLHRSGRSEVVGIKLRWSTPR